MALAVGSPLKNEESFLLEDILDQRSMKKAALERAAQITPLVKSITLGPNSSFRVDDFEEKPELPLNLSEKSLVKRKSAPSTKSKAEEPTRSNNVKTSPITPSDLEALKLKLYQESEDRKIREKVRKQLEEKKAKDQLHYQNVQQKLEIRRLEAEKEHKEKMEQLDRSIAAALKLDEQEEMKYQNHRLELTKNARKVIEQQEKDLRDNLKRHEDKFNKLESTFNQIAQACNQENLEIIDLYKKHFESLKDLKDSCRSSLDGLKSVCVKAEDLCQGLVKANREFEEILKAQLAQQAQKAAEEQKAAAEAEKARQVVQVAQPQQEVVQQTVAVPRSSSESERRYNELMHFLSEKQNATKRLTEAPELQKLRFALKLAVNTPINHLNEQNRATLVEGFQNLQSLLSGQRITTTQGIVSITEHAEASDWTKLRIAEKLINVVEKKNTDTFFIAAVTVALWQQFPDFGQMFLALLFKECPFLLPHKPRQIQGQLNVDFLKSWGYRMIDQVEEKYVNYQSRTSNFAALISAIWVTSSRREAQAPHPLGIDNAWKYLVNVLSSQPNPMYLHLIDRVLEVAGSTLHASYGPQFVKVVMMVRDFYLPSVERNVDEIMKGAFDRLRDITIANFFRESRFPQPKNKLNANFW